MAENQTQIEKFITNMEVLNKRMETTGSTYNYINSKMRQVQTDASNVSNIANENFGYINSHARKAATLGV
jgi:hypothetical protein